MSTLRSQILLSAVPLLAMTGLVDSRADVPVEGGTATDPTPTNLLGGNNEVFSLALSPDGRQLAAASGYWDRCGSRKPRRPTGATPKGPVSDALRSEGERVQAANAV